ncbi:MAG: glycine zipper domain-containing protein [Gemmatimonadota bacterium]
MRVKRGNAAWASLLFLAIAACGGTQGNTQEDADAQATEEYASELAREGSGDEPRDENVFEQPGLPAGTEIQVELGEELSTSESRTGDIFTATVVSPIELNGVTAIPSGAEVEGRVTAVQQAEGEQPAVLKIDFTQVRVDGESYPMRASVVEANPEMQSTTSTGEDVAKVGAGAAAGAIVGRIIGGDATGTLVGAAVGAAAGTAIVLGTEESEAVLPEGSIVTLRLDESLRIDAPATR